MGISGDPVTITKAIVDKSQLENPQEFVLKFRDVLHVIAVSTSHYHSSLPLCSSTSRHLLFLHQGEIAPSISLLGGIT